MTDGMTLRSSAIRILLAGASLVVITAGMRAAAGILNQFFMAIFILLIVLPIWRWLRRKGTATWLANTLVILGVVIGMLALVGFLGVSISRLIDIIPTYQGRLEAEKAALEIWLASIGVDATDLLAFEIFDPRQIFQTIAALVVSAIPAVAGLVFTLFIFVFALLDAQNFPARLSRILPPGSDTLTRLATFGTSVGDFMRIRAGLGVFNAAADIVLFLLVGVDLPLLWGVLAFFASFIPYIGYWLALIPPLLLTFLKFGWGQALVFFVGFHLINGFTENVLAPKFLGEGLHLSALATLLAVIYWGWVLGPIGTLLALPLTVAVKMLILEQHADTLWAATAISSGDGAAAPGDGDESAGKSEPGQADKQTT